MKVTINFKIDRELLDVAIRSLIFNNTRICEKNIKDVIKKQVESKGSSCIHFPENWGDDLFEHEYDEEYIEIQVEKYGKYLIEN